MTDAHMTDATLVYVVWALVLGAVSAVSLPLGKNMGSRARKRAPHWLERGG
jgi:hypothetical protein